MRLLPLLRNGFLALSKHSPRGVTGLPTLLEAWKKVLARSHLGRRDLAKSGKVTIRGRMNIERMKEVAVWYTARKTSNRQLRLLAGAGKDRPGCADTMTERDRCGAK